MKNGNGTRNNRILVIDDNPSIHQDIRKILGGQGERNAVLANTKALLFEERTAESAQTEFEIVSAFQGEEGLRKVEEAAAAGHPYAVAFIDVRMPPGWDGVETITRIWKDYPDLQVVICTAYSDYSWDEMIRKIGKSDSLVILKKPFDNIEVLQLAHALTQKWALSHEVNCRLNNLDQLVAQRTTELQAANQKLKTEITERLQAEKALQMFQFATDQAAVAIFWANREAGFRYVNDEACRSLGYTREELMRLQVFDIIPSFPKEQWEESWHQLDGKHIAVQQLETVHRRKDGSTFPVEIVAKHFSMNGVGLRVAFVRDITERKQAGETLARERTLLRTLIDNLPDTIFAKDTAGRKILANAVDLKYLHCQTEAEAIGKTDFEFYPRDVAANFHADDQKVIQGQPVLNREEYNYHEMGEKRWLLTSKLPLRDQSGKIIGLVGIGRDITEHKRDQEKIRQQAALLDEASDAIWTLDLNEGINYWNKGAERLYGWTAAEAIGKNPVKLLCRENATLQSHAFIQAVRERGEWAGELGQFTKDGKAIIVYARTNVIRDEQGQRKSVLIISTDITEKKKLETRFLRSQRMDSLGALAGGIAHDLNNVLTPLMFSVQLLKEKITDADGQKVLHALEANVERGAKLVKQVLTFGRGIQGERVAVQPAYILREIRQIIQETFPKSMEFECDCPSGLWTITGDSTQLYQVLLNLCVNARDAMPEGGKLSIRLKNVALGADDARLNFESKPGPFVVFEVTDTGMGIPKEIQDCIFEPFFTTKKTGQGTGLGLSTTLGIVRSHGGFIHCYSEPGKGSTFKVYLPANPTPEAREKAATEPTELPRGHGELVLVVDDEVGIREVAQKTLERFGYRVLSAANGAEAMSIYTTRRDEIAVVLTDMAMPVMDGPATIAALQSLNPEVKIIGSSGFGSRYVASQANGNETEHFIRKPYTTAAMLHALHVVLGTAAN